MELTVHITNGAGTALSGLQLFRHYQQKIQKLIPHRNQVKIQTSVFSVNFIEEISRLRNVLSRLGTFCCLLWMDFTTFQFHERCEYFSYYSGFPLFRDCLFVPWVCGALVNDALMANIPPKLYHNINIKKSLNTRVNASIFMATVTHVPWLPGASVALWLQSPVPFTRMHT